MTTLLKNIPDGNSYPNFYLGQRFNPFKQFDGSYLPEQISRYKGISPGAKVIYARLCRYAGENGEAWPSMDTLGEECGVSKTTARDYIRELEKAKFLEFDGRSGDTNLFFFLWHSAFTGDVGISRDRFTVRHIPAKRKRPAEILKPEFDFTPTETCSPPHTENCKGTPTEICSRNSHHQIVRGNSQLASPASRLEVPTDSEIKATAKPSLNGVDDEKSKSKPSGDGRDSLLQELRDAPRSTTDQEARERTRKLIALGKERDLENAVRVLDKRLRDTDGLWIEYWEKAKLTEYPRKVGGGHYTNLVKGFLVDRAVASEQRRMQHLIPKREELNFIHVCEDGRGCTALGELADGTVCSCKTGRIWQRMKEQSYQRRMPPSVATPASCNAAGAA